MGVLISAIVAMGENGVIGKDNKLPWHLPADLKHFKEITTGHPIVMGRKTFESIGKPLPNRTNIVLTRNREYRAEGCVVVSSLDDALRCASETKSEEIFIIGGAEIYKELMPRINRIYLTIVHHSFEGDAFFPQSNMSQWKEVTRSDYGADEKNQYAYSFILLERISSRNSL